MRQIKLTPSQPGVNEITVHGLTPTLDIDSVKVEGSGSAVITDISVELRPNKETFSLVYPDDSESDDDDLEYTEIKDSPALLSAKAKADKLSDKFHSFKEKEASALKRLEILDSYSASLNGETNSDIAKFMDQYKEARLTAFQDSEEAKQALRDMRNELDEAKEAVSKLQKIVNKARQKHSTASSKERQKRRSARLEKNAEKERIKKERLKFWPNMCHCVTVTLDVNLSTPLSSRRNSISSEIDIVKVAEDAIEDSDAVTTCDLLLSYMTSSAWWTPSYDLQLSTTANNATMCFDALLRNQTSESWKNCKVSLSTSETASSGLDDEIPKLLPWHIRLSGKKQEFGFSTDITRSANEISNRANYASKLSVKKATNTGRGYFGASTAVDQMAPSQNNHLQAELQFQQQQQIQQRQLDSRRGGLFGSATGSSAFGAPAPAGVFGNAAPQASVAAAPVAWSSNAISASNQVNQMNEHDEKTDLAEPPTDDNVDFEESLMEATGLTTTYDLPGTKTMTPKSVASKQRVARINFGNVSFSHTVVAKYKPVAYLKAKLKNSSKLNLMQGAAGLTLDGTFIGRSKIPRCSSGDVFTLNLGVDPAIKVSYPKPEVRRATAGIFNKEDSSVYARAIILYNTRATSDRAASMLVLDQIPVSEDDKLRVDVVTPTGLVQEGKAVATGAPLREMGRDKDWGKASARLKERGLVHWNVDLNAGKAVKLWLEYCVTLPTGDSATEC